MVHVLSGFIVIFIVIVVGYLLAKQEALGPGGQRALSSVVYLVATPCLLFDKLLSADPRVLFSGVLGVVALSALVVGCLFFLISRFLLRRSAPESIIGMLSSSYANGGNLGIPLAAYILGDATVVIPLMLFQIAIYAPAALTSLDILLSRNRARRLDNLLVALKNPMLLASLAGITLKLLQRQVPAIISQPVHLLAGASVPMALLVFGMSLHRAHVLEKGSHRIDVFLAALGKNLIQPLVSAALGLWVFGMTGDMLHAVIMLGALPTAQNVYTYALQFRVGEQQARDAGVVTTMMSVPVILLISMVCR
ncbi:AEC family transporter [Corynebacterium poyangense]|uniref:AEC family transporter n=1 Tax=Corynebacterium poyangense TaxID=2684405 RepID=A0A7H0SSF7_9CORY|nr:AEC family transporter [Corynebacterium poyangense]MBZ8178408.1 AEC family transporter [Corynebacterium poyangense]QNQ91482.1 AEC family transporter [Corynebacterium poyangense]